MALSLIRLRNIVAADPGLKANVSPADMALGLAAVDSLSALLIDTITRLNLNEDHLITEADLMAVSDAIRADAAAYDGFLIAHGDDEWNGETGYHLLQNDGGKLMFQGRKLVDTVVDAIFHTGFTYSDGRFVNEDGNQNEQVADVAGWLNYFLNGVNAVYGTAGADELYSGDYSAALTGAADETWFAGAGDDSVWADLGNDIIWTGSGHDKAGGGLGNDVLHGEDGQDTLWGDAGDDQALGDSGQDVIGLGLGNDTGMGGADNDTLYGEEGDDLLNGEDGDDQLYAGDDNDSAQGGAGNDVLSGDDGRDTLAGEGGSDRIYGGNGNDRLLGGDGADTLSGGDGYDVISGGAGADRITLWETVERRDTLVFVAGDSGKTRATIDSVEGFTSGVDKISLRAFSGMVFEDLDYRGDGTASCYFDGRYLRIDGNGDAVTDMIVEFKWQDELVAGDFLFA